MVTDQELTIKYAFREDPYSLYQLTVGSSLSREKVQVLAFRRQYIALGFLQDYYFLDSKTVLPSSRLTEYGKTVRDLNWENPYCYVAKVDCQIEFTVRRSLLEKIQSLFVPVWTADTFINYYNEKTSGYIVLLRVYKADTCLDVRLLEKGRQGSSQIIKLYDIDEEVSISAKRLDPVVSDGLFYYIKDELLSLIKRENALIAKYENNPAGIDLLSKRIKADSDLRPKAFFSPRQYDPNSVTDMAQSDYSALYKKILEKAPGMYSLIEYAKNVQPAQWGEIDYLVNRIKKGDEQAKQRLFDTQLRVALKSGLWASERYRVDLEEAIQEAAIGLMKAIDKFLYAEDAVFGRYAPMWMKQNMMRELPIAEENCRIPIHFLEQILPIVDWVRENEERIYTDSEYHQEAISRIQKTFECDLHSSLRILGLAMPPESLSRLIASDDESLSDKGAFDDYMFETAKAQSLHEMIEEAFALIKKDRNAEIIKKRFGFSGRARTLEELGAEYDVTRERIRQIEVKSLERIKDSSIGKRIKALYFEE